MIQYKCDMCESEMKSGDTVHIIKDFPRRVQYWVTANKNVKICSFTRYETAETHLCDDCFRKLANAFAIVE